MNILSVVNNWTANPNDNNRWLKTSGLQYHRQIAPYNHLAKNYDCSIHTCKSVKDLFTEDGRLLKDVLKYDLVIFLREVLENDYGVDVVKAIQEQGVKVIIDIDDLWRLPKYHPLNEYYTKTNYQYKREKELSQADYVTTTTDHFRYNYIESINKNCEVLPNSIDISDAQWVSNKTESNFMRFGWVGGTHHALDLREIKDSFSQVYTNSSTKNLKFQFCLGGYGNNPEYNYIESLMTDNYKHVPSWYKTILEGDDMSGQHYSLTQNYRRLYAKPVNEYGEMYDEIDVALVPLIANNFSSCKSPLKVVEAGFKKCAVICQNILPYSSVINKSNAFLVEKREDWFKQIKYCLLNKEAVKDKAEKLHEDMVRDFSMDVCGKRRYDLYKKIIGK